MPRFFLAGHRARLGLLRRRERRVARHGERRCDHLHDTVSRYDHAAKRLELLLTCAVCETEKVIHSLAYEPRFEPSVARVHALHPREAALARRLRQRTLEITFVESDAEAYSFTFGQSGDGDE